MLQEWREAVSRGPVVGDRRRYAAPIPCSWLGFVTAWAACPVPFSTIHGDCRGECRLIERSIRCVAEKIRSYFQRFGEIDEVVSFPTDRPVLTL